ASAEGKDCIVLGVPQTYPPRPLRGLMVTSFLTPSIESQYTHPAELKHEIADTVGEYMLDVEGFRTEDKDALLKQIYAMTEQRFALARHFARTKPWDLFFLVEMGPDRIQHGFWKYCDPEHRKYEPGNPYENAILDYYKYLDREIGELLGELPRGTSVIVVSDHGAKRMDGSVNINDWMIEAGFMQLSGDIPEPCELREAPVDWPNTKAWGSGGYYARVFMNVQGREQQGCINRADYEAERDTLADALRAIPDDTGRVMDTKVHKPQEVYTGPYVDEAPDLLVYFDDLYWRSSQTVGNGSIHSFETEIGPDDAMHAEQGMFIIAGGGIRGGQRLTDVDILDGAPTILRSLGLPIREDMEGKVIE
ncbi:MAG: alkaline phosphatase family protein, partial [Armatimonadota bacterium]